MLPVHPKIALSCATVAPLFAARVAPILRSPCADLFTPAFLQASENALPNDSFVIGLPFAPQTLGDVCGVSAHFSLCAYEKAPRLRGVKIQIPALFYFFLTFRA